MRPLAALGWLAVLAPPMAAGSAAQAPRPPSLDGIPSASGDRIVFAHGAVSNLRLPGGAVVEVHSLLSHDRQPLRFGEFAWDDAGIPPGRLWVRVDTERQILSVFRAGHEIGTAVVIFGAEAKATPHGLFPILSRSRQHRSSLYDASMPYTLRLTGDGVSIHGAVVRPGFATHGCIGVPLEFAEQLFDAAHVGDMVAIV